MKKAASGREEEGGFESKADLEAKREGKREGTTSTIERRESEEGGRTLCLEERTPLSSLLLLSKWRSRGKEQSNRQGEKESYASRYGMKRTHR